MIDYRDFTPRQLSHLADDGVFVSPYGWINSEGVDMSERIDSVDLELSEDGKHMIFNYGVIGEDDKNKLWSSFLRDGVSDPIPFEIAPAGSVECDGVEFHSPLWRRILVWLGLKSFGRYEVRYRYVQLHSVDFVGKR